jgi:hypothetical protein
MSFFVGSEGDADTSAIMRTVMMRSCELVCPIMPQECYGGSIGKSMKALEFVVSQSGLLAKNYTQNQGLCYACHLPERRAAIHSR